MIDSTEHLFGTGGTSIPAYPFTFFFTFTTYRDDQGDIHICTRKSKYCNVYMYLHICTLLLAQLRHQSMPLCTNCAETVDYLYTLYHSVNNVRLEQCVRMHSLSHLMPLLSPYCCSPHVAHLQILTSSMTYSSLR